MPTAQLVWLGSIDRRDGIIDLLSSGWLGKKERARLDNEAIGRRMTHSQGSNSVAKHSALMVPHARRFPRHSILSHQNTEKFQGMPSFNARTDTGFLFSRLLPALPSQQGRVLSLTAVHDICVDDGTQRKFFNDFSRACVCAHTRRVIRGAACHACNQLSLPRLRAGGRDVHSRAGSGWPRHLRASTLP
jgi:hypothetical protein